MASLTDQAQPYNRVTIQLSEKTKSLKVSPIVTLCCIVISDIATIVYYTLALSLWILSMNLAAMIARMAKQFRPDHPPFYTLPSLTVVR